MRFKRLRLLLLLSNLFCILFRVIDGIRLVLKKPLKLEENIFGLLDLGLVEVDPLIDLVDRGLLLQALFDVTKDIL